MMSEANDSLQIERLLDGAAAVISNAFSCWLVTDHGDGWSDSRPMGLITRKPAQHDWTFDFVIDGRSRKATEIRRSQHVSMIFQENTDAYIAFRGEAILLEKPEDVARMWKDEYCRYFPTETERANAIFVQIRVERMKLWIRGLTPEPFGLEGTTLFRSHEGHWRLTAAA